MPFTKHCSLLTSFQKSLSAIEKPSHLQILVLGGVDDIAKSCNIFDSCITLDSPFFNEFFHCINTQDSFQVDDESCFSIFECLVIFFREKRLRFGFSRLSQAEKDVLDYFENSGYWEQAENTIVGNWYWHTLPQKVMHDYK